MSSCNKIREISYEYKWFINWFKSIFINKYLSNLKFVQHIHLLIKSLNYNRTFSRALKINNNGIPLECERGTIKFSDDNHCYSIHRLTFIITLFVMVQRKKYKSWHWYIHSTYVFVVFVCHLFCCYVRFIVFLCLFVCFFHNLYFQVYFALLNLSQHLVWIDNVIPFIHYKKPNFLYPYQTILILQVVHFCSTAVTETWSLDNTENINRISLKVMICSHIV